MKFEKPPLIELIAEFRWLPISPSGEEISDPTLFLQPGPVGDAMYDALRLAVSESGYTLAERLVPVSFPTPPHTPIFRFSRADEKPSRTLYQAGAGLLSIHALPPYENWEAFKPVIATGLDALIASRSEQHRVKSFTRVTLRYIDAFTSDLIGTRSNRSFISDVLQLNLQFPKAFIEQSEDPDASWVAVQIRTRTTSGLDMTLSVGPNSNVGSPQKIIMDTMVGTPQSIEFDREAVLAVLENAHSAIRHLFFGMTEELHSEMRLVPEGGTA